MRGAFGQDVAHRSFGASIDLRHRRVVGLALGRKAISEPFERHGGRGVGEGAGQREIRVFLRDAQRPVHGSDRRHLELGGQD
jgi:hypothetical protein